MAEQIRNYNVLRRGQLETKTGLSRSTIYAKNRFDPKRPSEYDPAFPRPIRLGAKSVGWIEHEVDAWIAAQIQKSRKG